MTFSTELPYVVHEIIGKSLWHCHFPTTATATLLNKKSLGIRWFPVASLSDVSSTLPPGQLTRREILPLHFYATSSVPIVSRSCYCRTGTSRPADPEDYCHFSTMPLAVLLSVPFNITGKPKGPSQEDTKGGRGDTTGIGWEYCHFAFSRNESRQVHRLVPSSALQNPYHFEPVQAWKMAGKCLGNGWEMAGKWLENAWEIAGKCLEKRWKMPGKTLENAWKNAGKCLEIAVEIAKKRVELLQYHYVYK